MRGIQGAIVDAAASAACATSARQGTASLDLCFVAAGRLNAYFERTLSPWDHAAGAIIAREAGAVVKGLGDAAPSRDFILAAHPDAGRRARTCAGAEWGGRTAAPWLKLPS